MATHLLVGWQVALELALELPALVFSVLQLAYETVYRGVMKHLGLLSVPLQLCHCGFQLTNLAWQVPLA